MDAVISNLGKLAESVECCFSCGGTMPQVENIVLFYKKQSGDWSPKPLELPSGLTDEHVQEFLDSCSTASFGIGNETVVDKEYRDALKLEPDRFYANFEIANTSVLAHITRILSSIRGDVSSPVRAQLYMLNVYSTGGHFKSHVDTPRSKEMFGSLVVCLPSQFTGGALVTRHHGRQVTFDWSSSTATHWAAFYSDVEHEVLPVTSGHRITLTYNLYHTSPATNLVPTLLNVVTNPLYQELIAALQNPFFMRQGGTLGFFCQHKYTNISNDLENFSPYLKGEDALIYEIAKSLELSIALKPVSEGPDDEFWDDEVYAPSDTMYIIPKFRPKSFCRHRGREIHYGEKDIKFKLMREHFGDGVLKDDGITWCQDPKIVELIIEKTEYGNEPAGCDVYQAAAFLVEVPKFTSLRGSVRIDHTCSAEKSKPKKKKKTVTSITD